MKKRMSLIEFSVENYGPFQERATFSMSARKKDGHTFEGNGENLLRTSLIYGPNASGKSSILDAMYKFKESLLNSANTKDPRDSWELPHNPFLALKKASSEPTTYEMIFSLENCETKDNCGVFKYNFSVLPKKVVNESLIEILGSGKEVPLLVREGSKIETAKIFEEFSDFIVKQKTLKEDALVLSVFFQLNHKFTQELFSAFKHFNVITGVHVFGHREYTLNKFKDNSEFREKILKYLQKADFCIKGGEVRDVDSEDSTGKMRKFLDIFLLHPIFNSDQSQVDTFEIPLTQESDGTNAFLGILGPIIDTLEKGKVLFVDEFDNSLHPMLTKFIIELFESPEVNKNNAQLVVTTHDTSLLANKKLIRDQFWFTEKDKTGAAKLFSLGEYDLRNDTEYAKKYLEGRFGALPVIGVVTE